MSHQYYSPSLLTHPKSSVSDSAPTTLDLELDLKGIVKGHADSLDVLKPCGCGMWIDLENESCGCGTKVDGDEVMKPSV